MALILHIDGGARGNPGPAGAGVVIKNDRGQSLHEAGYFLGQHTNNAAEYQALILGLKRAARLDDPHISIYSDSELLVNQITGRYRVKSAKLLVYVEQAQALLLKFDSWTIQHVRREANQRADRLANLAMDRAGDAPVLDIDGDSPRRQSPAIETGCDPNDDPMPPTSDVASDSFVAKRPTHRNHAIRVVTLSPPDPQHCPACETMSDECILQADLPVGMCIHAAHALLPTVLAMNNTNAKEFAALPAVTVRCMKPDCGAVFSLLPVKSPNGAPRPDSAQ